MGPQARPRRSVARASRHRVDQPRREIECALAARRGPHAARARPRCLRRNNSPMPPISHPCSQVPLSGDRLRRSGSVGGPVGAPADAPGPGRLHHVSGSLERRPGSASVWPAHLRCHLSHLHNILSPSLPFPQPHSAAARRGRLPGWPAKGPGPGGRGAPERHLTRPPATHATQRGGLPRVLAVSVYRWDGMNTRAFTWQKQR